MWLSGQFLVCFLFIFIFTKNSWALKNSNQSKPINKTKFIEQNTLFCVPEKNWNCPDNLIYYNTSFYFQWIRSVLKLCKIPKYYMQRRVEHFSFLFRSFIMSQVSKQNAFLTQVVKVIKKPPSIKVESSLLSIFHLSLTCKTMFKNVS